MAYRRLRRRQRGMIYAWALGIVLILTAASATLLTRSSSEMNLSEGSRNHATALHLADAALDQAARNLRTPSDTADDLGVTQDVQLATGSFRVDSQTSVGPSTWQVQARGTSAKDAGKVRRIEATFQLTPQSVFQFALFGDQQVNVGGSANTDSYDSRNGAYANPGNVDHHGDVGTNATTAGGINVGGSIFIDGQAAVGPGVANPTSVVTGYNPSFITGNPKVVSQGSAFPMPDVTVPPGLTCTDFTVNGSDTVTLAPGTYCYNNLTVQGNGTFTASGDVTVYLTGQLTAKGNSVVGVVDDPTKMLFLSTANSGVTLDESGTITGSNKFYGALYGPKATITMTGNADVYGAIIAKTVNLSGSAYIHYDTALKTKTDISNIYTTALVSWREL